MKKYLLTILIILLITVKGLAQTAANNQNNDIESARSIIAKYCNLLKLYAKKEDINVRKQLLDLVPKGYLVFNDFGSQYSEIEMFAYLNIISITYDNDIEIDFEEDISKISIVPYVTKNTTSSLFKGSITKKIKIKKDVKTVKNEIVVDINTKKIINIFQSNISDNITTIQESNNIDIFNNAVSLYNNNSYDSPERERALNILEKLANDGYYPAILNLATLFNGEKAFSYSKKVLDVNYAEGINYFIRAYNQIKDEKIRVKYNNDYQAYLNIGVNKGNIKAINEKAKIFFKQVKKQKSKALMDSVRNLYTRAVEIVGNEWEIGILIVEMDYFNGIKDKNKFDGLLKNILNASAYPLYIMEEIGIAYENNKEFETAMYYYILQETMVFVERKDTYVKFDKLVEDIPEKYQLNFLYNIQQDANKGNLQAMYILAHIYRYDYILKKNDDVIAEQWFSKANRQANGQLMNGNAIFYSNIYGCPISTLNSFINYAKLNNYSSKTYVDFILAQREENISKRAELMRELAEVYNIVEAQTYLGRLYLSDYLGEPNYIEAVFWFKKAAQQGDENGQFYLAYCYLDGLGLEVNTKEGIRLLEQAIEKKQKYALGMLGEIYLEGKYGVEKNETKALDFLKQAALQGDADAAYSVARLYKYSTSSTQNKNEAVKWYIKAAEMGNMNGQTEIAEMYLRGEGVTKNIQESIKWYEKATEQSDSEKSAFWAELRLGELYEEGEVVPRDIQTAMKWYRKGANQNEINCIYRLAKLLYNDNNHKESFVWFKIAAEKTLAPAQYTLGQMYLKGLGTEKNKSEAIKWYKKAANQGEEKAKEALKRLGY